MSFVTQIINAILLLFWIFINELDRTTVTVCQNCAHFSGEYKNFDDGLFFQLASRKVNWKRLNDFIVLRY